MKKIFSVFIAFLVFMPLQSASAATQHTVKWGDTMWKIAARYQVGVSEILSSNPQIKNPDMIYPGQTINVPDLGEIKQFEQKVVQLTNQERAKYGLKPLVSDWELARVARFKSDDMRDKNYFSHTSPTYGSPFDMIKNFGITYRSAGENIAAGQKTPEEVVQAWMNSSGHRANILNKDFTHIGVGYSKGGSYGVYWTQMFMSK
ncbi:putative YkwD family protein/spore coat assembly protein SafA [Bacillus fengqiuensis]|nr:putative YkwD family protein/spore coat assembly protein SafA [Bacillus fengqiuensis]